MTNANNLGGNHIFSAVEEAFGHCTDNHTDFADIAATGTPNTLPLDSWSDHDIAFEKGVQSSGESASIVILDSVQKFVPAYEALCQIVGAVPDYDRINSTVEHENAHAERAAQIGFKVITFNMAFFYDEAGNQCWKPFTLAADPVKPVRRIEVASLVAAPEVLSDSDDSYLEDLGYDLFSLTVHTNLYNEINGTSLPLPPAVLQHPLLSGNLPYPE